MRALITILLIIIDGTASSFAYWCTFAIRSGIDRNFNPYAEIISPMLFLSAFWITLNLTRGMYKIPIALSRFDEMIRIFKSVILGILILFVATFDLNEPEKFSRLFFVNYGLITFILLTSGRLMIRTFQRYLRKRGIGLWDAVIVGCNPVGMRLFDQLDSQKIWGFRIIGFVENKDDNKPEMDLNILGKTSDLSEIITKHSVEWILVAPENQARLSLLEVFNVCIWHKVRFMIVADYYQMVIGLVRTVEIHGLPLVEVAPELVSLLVRIFKRIIDISASIAWMLVLIIITPLIALICKLDSPGPVFYRQKRVGRLGKEFNLIKFRSMVHDAEKKSGEVWATKNDTRITRFGKFLRRSHIDEIPQFYNILKGDMSLVGPRPERKKFVEEFNKSIPLYERRLRVRPGITGWAQVRHKYDETFDDVREKTRYDLFYIDHMSIAQDLKIILLTFVKVLKGEGQ